MTKLQINLSLWTKKVAINKLARDFPKEALQNPFILRAVRTPGVRRTLTRDGSVSNASKLHNSHLQKTITKPNPRLPTCPSKLIPTGSLQDLHWLTILFRACHRAASGNAAHLQQVYGFFSPLNWRNDAICQESSANTAVLPLFRRTVWFKVHNRAWAEWNKIAEDYVKDIVLISAYL